VGFGEKYAKCGPNSSYTGSMPAANDYDYGHSAWAYTPVWNGHYAAMFQVKLLVSTGPTAETPQSVPTVDNCHAYSVQSMDAGGCLVSMMDGSVRNVSTSVSGPTWFQVIVPDDGQPLGSDW